jgi:hypothetical protein
MRSPSVVLLLAGILSLPAFADPVTYRIDFTGGSVKGTPLPFGSFTYDPNVGFSDFLVTWDGVTFDLTSSANAPELATDPATGCDSAAPDYQYGFIFVTQTATGCTVPAQYAWSGMYLGGSGAQFTLVLNVTKGLSAEQDLIGALVTSNVPVSPSMDSGVGDWSVSPESVPEPSSLTMGLALTLSLAGMILAKRFRRSR